MIKLKQPFNYKGLFHPAGAVLPVDTELAKTMVESGHAEYLNPEVVKQAEETANKVETASNDNKPPLRKGKEK